ncbi:MAG: MFS transporter [Thermoproteota archaeon]
MSSFVVEVAEEELILKEVRYTQQISLHVSCLILVFLRYLKVGSKMKIFSVLRSFFQLEPSLLFVSFSNFLIWLSVYISYLYNSPFLVKLGASATLLGAVYLIQNFISLLAYFLGGWMADFWDKKKLILLGWSAYVLSFFLLFISWNINVALVAIVMASISYIASPALFSFIANATSENNRGTVFGFLNAMNYSAATFGPIVATLIVSEEVTVKRIKLLYVCSLTISLLSLLVLAVFVGNSSSSKTSSRTSSSYKKNFEGFSKLLRKKVILYYLITYFVLSQMSMVAPFTMVYMLDIIKSPAYIVNLSFSITTLLGIPIVMLYGKLSDKLGRKALIIATHTANAFLMLWFTCINNAYLLLVYAILKAFTDYSSPLLAFEAELVNSDERGKLRGLLSVFKSLFSIPAPLIGGFLWSNISPRAPYYVVSLLEVLYILIFAFLVRRIQK